MSKPATKKDQQTELLHALNAAATSLQRSAHSEEDVFRVFREQVVALRLRGGLSLLDEDGNYLIFRAVALPEAEVKVLSRFERLVGLRAEGYRFNFRHAGAYGEVMETGQSVYEAESRITLVQILPEAARPFANPILAAFGALPAVFAPLTVEGKTQGVLEIFGERLAADDLPAVEAFANHLAIALNNARAVSALRESEARYRGLFEHSLNGFALHEIVTDADGRPVDYIFLEVNPAFERLTGLRAEAIIGKRITEALPGIENDPFIEIYGRAALTGEPIKLEQYATPLNKHFDIVAFSSQRGQFATVFTDITERKRAEASLRESEVMQRLILNSVDEAIYSTEQAAPNSLEGRVRFVSDQAEQILGYQPREFTNDPTLWFSLLHPDDAPAIHEQTAVIFASRQPSTRIYRVRHKHTAEYRWIEDRVVPQVDKDGNVIGTFGVARDITERKEALDEIRAYAEQYRMMISTDLFGFWLVDEHGKLLDVNDTYSKMSGYTKEELQNLSIPDLEAIEIPEETARRIQKIVETGKDQFVSKHKAKDGRVFDVEISVANWYSQRRFVVFIRDITERKQAEEKMRFQSTLLDAVGQAVIATDTAGIVTYLNRAAESLYGWLKDEAVGRNILDLTVPQVSQAQAIEIMTQLAAGKSWSGEFLVQHRDGRVFPALVHDSPVFDKEGKLIGIIGISSDITERKQAEERLRLQSTALDAAANAVFITDREGVIQWVNPAFSRITGFTAEQAIGRTPRILKSGLYPREFYEKLWRTTLAGDVWQGEMINRHRAGKHYTIHQTITPLREPDGEVTHFVAIQQDITEQVRAKEQIQNQLSRLGALRAIDAAITGSFDLQFTLKIVLEQATVQLIVDAACVLLLNPHTQTLEYTAGHGFRGSGITRSHLRLGECQAGRAALERRTINIPNLAEESTFVRAGLLAEEGFIAHYVTPLIIKGKVKGVLEVFHRAPLVSDSEWQDFLESLAGQAAIAIENTELFDGLQRSNIELEQRVAERTAELTHANRVKDEFLANMSHELRTPLNSILGFSETLLEQKSGPLNEKQEQYIELIHSGGGHLLGLINDILDVSKIEAGKLIFHPDIINIKEVCQASLSFVKELAIKKLVSIEFNNAQSTSTLRADPQRLKQILVNLLNNAVKFTPKNGKVTLEVSANVEKDQIQFSVIDTGIGIASDDLPRLFTPFTQLDSGLARHHEGTGLGLVLVYKLTNLHGGSVQVESEVGKGSRFTVTLPWSQDTTTQDRSAELEKIGTPVEINTASNPNSGYRGTILLVEDNFSNILVVDEYLQGHGYEVVVAHNGLEALAKAEEILPSVILMDIQMSEMDGLEATRRLRADLRFVSTPIIALTALAMPGDRERCLDAGANEYMSKPVSLKAMLKMIQSFLSDNEESKPS